MPAFLQSFIEAEQERSRRIEQLRKEIREFAKEEAGSSITEQILLFLADEMVEHLSEIDYELRMKFELYITPLIKRNYIYRYTGTFDRIRQAYIRERMKTPAGQRECEWKYKNEILFVPYHSDPVIVKSVETVRCRSNMVWNFKAAASEKLKRQIFTVLEYILKNYEISRLREYKLTGLQLFYEFCIREQITDIQLLELEQETAFQDYLKQKVEKEQRRKRLKSIVETARKVIFIETDETRWDATIWYLERFRIAKERINQSDSIEKISFQEVLQPKNRLLLQEYMKYEIGIGELALSTVYERFRTIRNFLQEISELEVTKCDASLIDVYLKNLQNGAMGAKTFNTNVSGIQFFMKFLEVKGYIKKVPFYASYYLEKQIPVHHDRSVEEDVYMEIIQNLSQFPEHLRMMFLHLWCVGLRISEVCTLKGDAYYIQNGDCWMKVYQVKMKNYKRVPIPVTLYRLMQVYLKKHPTKKEAYIFRNRKGGAFSKSTFMGQMKKYCSQIGIQNGEYIFKSHDYRHTVATNFYEHGVSIQSIRDYLGHTFEEMTMQYIDYMPRKIAKENDAYFEEEENSLLACIRDDLLKLRNVLETIGKIYDFPHLTKLFLKSDFPPERKAEFKSYSDSELKRLNAQIVKMEEQIARAMIIHQMLGTRISDTLTLRKDCLYKHDRQDMIIIYQPKTRRYEKPISRELAQLIGKAVSYANEHYPESIYIFADENKPERPISYQTLQDKVLRMIYEKDIRDDSGKLFGFGTHMFRHCYGVKLTELHVDDWTIAKLLGHKGVKSVQYYRKMSNQRLADETREVRNLMSQIILANLDGWGEEYEQIRQDAGIE